MYDDRVARRRQGHLRSTFDGSYWKRFLERFWERFWKHSRERSWKCFTKRCAFTKTFLETFSAVFVITNNEHALFLTLSHLAFHTNENLVQGS